MNNSPLLVTMRGPGGIDFTKLSNFEAGIAMLALINKEYPGITLSQLSALTSLYQAPEKMAGWLTDIGHFVGNVKDGIGDVLKDTVNTVGGVLGSTVRLAADPKVTNLAANAAAAYATGGGSLAVQGAISNMTGGGTGTGSIADQIMNFIAGLGSNAKTQVQTAGYNGSSAPTWLWPVVIGGIGVVGVVTVMRGGKGRRR